ncbi:MAG: alpha/beta fold hydrolase [Thaumarchaeota archaeon]|nr:alpha/beta fold hydrolase [Nitrososphaerota archaeon]
MPFIDVDGVQIFVQEWGNSNAKPVVFLHGWPFSHRIFEYQMRELAEEGFRSIGIDLRGFGASEKPWQGNDYDTWASDVKAVLHKLSLQGITLVGFSMGGAVATCFAAHYDSDQRVSRLVLLGAPLPSSAPTPELRQAKEDAIKSLLSDQAAFDEGFIKKAFHAAPSQELLQFLVNIGTSASLHGSIRGLEELRDRDLTAEMDSIAIPTLICHGVFDQVVAFHLAEIQSEVIKGSRLVRFENSGHAMMYEERDKLAMELARFADPLAEATFKCATCGATFPTEAALEGHVRAMHVELVSQ